jgi:hypothetical protein
MFLYYFDMMIVIKSQIAIGFDFAMRLNQRFLTC